MAITNPTPLIYDDPKLAVMVQQVVFATPWVTQPTNVDFPVTTLPRMTIPQLSWIVQDEELNWREKLIAYLNPLLGDDFSAPINGLPGNFITAVLSNLFYNSRAYVDSILPPRLDEMMSGSPYAVSAYWVGYHLAGMLAAGITVETINDAAYQKKQLNDLQRIFAYMIGNILQSNPVIRKSNHVIIGAQSGSATRGLIFVDADNLDTYFNNGHTIDELCTNWFMTKADPTV
jgi:hypothetical protein